MTDPPRWHRRDFVKLAGWGLAWPLLPAAAVAGQPRRASAPAGGAPRFALLSKKGGDRATAYVMSNKIARRRGSLVCTWLQSNRQNHWAAVDPDTGNVSAGGPVGPVERDNHCGAALATGVDGDLHLVIGAHHGPFMHYRMPSSADRWELVGDGRAGGPSATYPSLVCDGKGTLHLTYRCEPGGHDARLHYCRRPAGGAWSSPRVLAQSAVSEHSWLTNAIEVGPAGRLHVVMSNTLPVPDAGAHARYYGASHLCSDDSGQTWRQLGSDRPLDLPVHGTRLKRIEGDGLDPARIEQHYGGKAGPRHSYYHKILLSNPAVDEQGRPWVVVHNLLRGSARLYRHEDSRGWLGTALLDAVESVLPGFRIRHCAQLTRHRDGAVEAVLMASPEAKPGWGAEGTALVRMVFGADGQIRRTEPLRPADPGLPQWLPSLERFCPHAPVGRPALLFTRGVNAGGYGQNRNSVCTEVWLRLS